MAPRRGRVERAERAIVFKNLSGMLALWIISGFFFFPAGFSRVLDSAGEREVRSINMRSRERSGSNFIYKPSLRIRSTIPVKMRVKTGENNVLECEAGGNPPPTIRWLKDGNRISQSIHPEDGGKEAALPILGLSFTRSRLFLDCVTEKDTGEYTCVAENCALSTCTSTTKTTRMVVDGRGDSVCLFKKTYGSPARIHMWTHTRLEIQGSDVQLFCRAEGEPRPQIMWLGPNNKPLVNPEKYEILSNGDLIIRNINWEDMGGYTCAVSNDEGYDETTTFLYPTAPENETSAD